MASATAVPLQGIAPNSAVRPKKRKLRLSRKKAILLLLALAAAAVLAYTQLLPGGHQAVAPPARGPVLKLDSITLNLAEGHFLKLGLSLEFKPGTTFDGASKPETAPALDLAIEQLSNLQVTQLNSTPARELAKKQLTASIRKAYYNGVTRIYFTEFVMQ